MKMTTKIKFIFSKTVINVFGASSYSTHIPIVFTATLKEIKFSKLYDVAIS